MVVKNTSDAFSDILLKAWLHRDVSVLPTSYFVGLTLALPLNQNGLGVEEPGTAEYIRVEVAADSDSWVSMGEGSRLMTLDPELLYPEAVTDWGEILGYVLYDSLTDGMYLGYGETNGFMITAGIIPRIPSRSIVVSEGALNGQGGAPFWYDLTGDAAFPSDAPIGAYGFDSITGDVWRNV